MSSSDKLLLAVFCEHYGTKDEFVMVAVSTNRGTPSQWRFLRDEGLVRITPAFFLRHNYRLTELGRARLRALMTKEAA